MSCCSPRWPSPRCRVKWGGQTAAPPADDSVPANLTPLLASPQSEMRLVTLMYNTDRGTLNGDFDTGRAGGAGAAVAAGRARRCGGA